MQLHGLIGQPHVQRIAIDIAVHGHCLDAHLFARPNDPAGNLAPIGDQNLAKFACAGTHNAVQSLTPNVIRPERTSDIGRFGCAYFLKPKSGCLYSTGCPFST